MRLHEWARRRLARAASAGQPRPWGPFCYVRQGRHPAPYAKRPEGRARRQARRLKQVMREAALADREYDDGYFPLGST